MNIKMGQIKNLLCAIEQKSIQQQNNASEVEKIKAVKQCPMGAHCVLERSIYNETAKCTRCGRVFTAYDIENGALK